MHRLRDPGLLRLSPALLGCWLAPSLLLWPTATLLSRKSTERSLLLLRPSPPLRRLLRPSLLWLRMNLRLMVVRRLLLHRLLRLNRLRHRSTDR